MDFILKDFISCENSANGESIDDKQEEFLSRHTLIDTTLNGECKLILPFNLTAFDYDNNNNNNNNNNNKSQSLMYLTTSNAKLIRISINNQDSSSLSERSYKVLSILNLSKLLSRSQSNELINELVVNVNYNLIYFTTQFAVYQIDLIKMISLTCNNYVNCFECRDDPSCEWSSLFKKCDLKNVSKNLYENSKIFSTNSECHLNNVSVSQAIGVHSITPKSIRVSAFVGQSLSLNCGDRYFDFLSKINSNFLVYNNIKWYKNNQLIEMYNNNINNSLNNIFLSTNGQLIFLALSPDHSAIYRCSIDSKSQLISFNLTVQQRSIALTEQNKQITKNSDNKNMKYLNNNLNLLLNFLEDYKRDCDYFKLKMHEFEITLNCSFICD